ncbi:hypothetical protein [Sphingomonas sp. 8AM]|uniref:hypothetical protein n=1 Tax=Sphingomonas sp. 8AM TaxID=2653170 RepID=UPI0012F0889E|nr:hypothetical protein [Sphingomonas sp. 8AM]VXC88492.1 conserved hypothetical protein [Sphingomonas sp. 8AM]
MAQDATSNGIPPHGAYAVRDPHAADALATPLRAAFRREAKMPCEIEACLDQLRRVRFRG